MEKVKLPQKIFAVALIIAWLGYAVFNVSQQAPTLSAGYQRGWDFDSSIDNIKQTADGSFAAAGVFQNINGYKSLLTGSEMIPVGSDLSIIRGKDGYLYYSNNFPYETYDYGLQALQLREMQTAAQKRGGSMIFVNCPDLFIEGMAESELPISNWNARSNALLYALSGYGVASMDARQVLTQSELDPSLYRYKTEPHWTTQASFEVYLALLEWMSRNGGAFEENDFFVDRGNYIQTTYEDAFSGQLGQLVGIPYAGYEDFTLIEPDFDTSFTMSYEKTSMLEQTQGDFASVLLEQRWIDTENPYKRNMYNVYLTSVYSLRVISNELNQNGPKVLVIGDSHMLPVASLLATAASELCLLWSYGVPDTNEGAENMLDFIEANDFDYIIVGMNPGSMYEGGFNFLAGIEVSELAN